VNLSYNTGRHIKKQKTLPWEALYSYSCSVTVNL
jgi:hypothetical protein